MTSFKVTVELLTETFFSLSNGSPSITFPYESNILPNILSEYSTSKPSDFFTTIAPFSNPLVLYKLRHVADILFISTTSKTYLEFPSISKISPIFIEVFDNIIAGRMTFQRAFMTGEMTARGNLKTLRMLDELFTFTA